MRRLHALWLATFMSSVVPGCGGKGGESSSTTTVQGGTSTADRVVTAGSGGTSVAGTTSATGGTESLDERDSDGGSAGASSGGASIGIGGSGGETVTGGSGGTDTTSSSGGTAGSTSPTDECQLDSDAEELGISLPQTLTFSLTNTQSTTVYLYTSTSCAPAISIYSCGDNYESALAYTPGCTTSCETEGDSCVACSACPETYEAIAPGATVTRQWSGSYYTFVPQTYCSCYEQWTAPSGKYRISIAIYSSNVTSESNTPTTVLKDFGYPDLDGVVTVEL